MNLESSLSSIKGVGPKTAEKLAGAGFSTVGDIIDFLPRTYEDFSQVVAIKDLAPGKVTIKARAENVSTRRPRFRMTITEGVLRDDTGAVRAVWFNQFYRQKQLETGEEFYVSGVFEFARGRYQLTNPSVEAMKDLPVQTGRVLPVYPAIKGLKPALTRSVLDKLRPVITMLPESLPEEIVATQKLVSRADAMSGLHFPESAKQADAAQERLAFEELFELLLASQLNRQENSKLKGFPIKFNQTKIKEFVAKLPFEMTGAQKRALWDILQDFEKTQPMNRMLQGDVGSGKTVVAGAAGFQAAIAGYQTAIMAPTEILASQHAKTLDGLLSPFGIRVALLTGSVKGKAREELYEAIESGDADVVVGTHALFQPDVKFNNLGFVVIDEQHRFGVKQRQALLAKSSECDGNKGKEQDDLVLPEAKLGSADRPMRKTVGLSHAPLMPHLLSMTATPIPRSLQLTVFGDLDISILNELPKGRQAIETKIFRPKERDGVYGVIEEQLAQGRQAYIVTPLIDEGIDVNAEKRSAEEEFKTISKKFKNRKIGLLHGKMKPSEKEEVMREFAEHKTDILVATTVVEVGVDVPNSTIMMIENADNFGLSQLHQLRGRVGRGEHKSYCFLMLTENKSPSRRLKEIEKSNDGFYLSEVDLQLRGPGQIYGTMQHGELNLQIANLADTKLIKRASDSAKWFVENKTLTNFPVLAKNVIKYQKLTSLN